MQGRKAPPRASSATALDTLSGQESLGLGWMQAQLGGSGVGGHTRTPALGDSRMHTRAGATVAPTLPPHRQPPDQGLGSPSGEVAAWGMKGPRGYLAGPCLPHILTLCRVRPPQEEGHSSGGSLTVAWALATEDKAQSLCLSRCRCLAEAAVTEASQGPLLLLQLVTQPLGLPTPSAPLGPAAIPVAHPPWLQAPYPSVHLVQGLSPSRIWPIGLQQEGGLLQLLMGSGRGCHGSSHHW